YELLATIHQGKHSRIYRVQDKLLGRTLALKHIEQSYPDRAAYLQQMKDRTALHHPNILRIYDIDDRQGRIAMEYVAGHDLRYVLRLKGALAPKMVMYIATQLVNGLHQAHNHGIIHHALTPEHILLTRQCHLKITAFRAPDSFMQLQKTDDPYKYLYIPPELFRQATLTVASNVYSFGVILYEMLVGSTPFRLQQLRAFLHQHDPLEYDDTPLPQGIQPIIRRCLALSPDQRYPHIRAVGEKLIEWYKHGKRQTAHDENIRTYKDYLLMAWADGAISPVEADFLAHKRQELHITASEASTAETEVKEELNALLNPPDA
ncbi:protein kinase, partial [candidate division KSB3 bacterium]|nr:protein kinase [candidate division KSB3 bacterium]MBD3324368.1 protein kinase [candidate division KSB3 bacterium]